MSLQHKGTDQVLNVEDAREATEAVVHRRDASRDLLFADRYAFQRDAIRAAFGLWRPTS